MTQKEKQILLQDLCARLPYGVKVAYLFWDERKGEEYIVPMTVYSVNADGYMELIGDVDEEGGHVEIDKYLMYLRPMSSMTDKERFEYLNVCGNEMENALSSPRYSGIDWLNAHHFDYRGLIPKGLAIEVTEENNPYKV